MSLILAQFVSKLLLTMCKVYQDFYNQTIYKIIIIGLICFIDLLKPSLFLKFNTFIHILTTIVCLVFRFVVVLFNKSENSFKSNT